jgi:hypothetical protein
VPEDDERERDPEHADSELERLARSRRHRAPGVAVARLDGVWRIERESGVLPPFGLSKRIFGTSGWTLVAGLPAAYFTVRLHAEDATLDYVGWPVRDELSPREDGSWSGRGLLLGREFCRFRLVREGT